MTEERAFVRLSSLLSSVAVAICIGLPAAGAQTSTGSIRGYIRDANAAPAVGATVTARNIASGAERNTLAGENGFYNLAGLRPDRYVLSVRRVGFSAQADTVTLLIGQVLSLDFSLSATAVTLQSVIVTGGGDAVIETRTSEIATNVTREQIENLPQADRNFLKFALLAPGTRTDQSGNIAADAQSANNINLFIDGASYKSDILPGGVAGQDPGNQNPAFNPFPQSAVQEFRVITQNFKAEYQKASSAIITATTKSGSNEWSGDAYFYAQPSRFVARNFFETQDNRAAPEIDRRQFGVSGGGPIIRDRLHFFGAVEVNDQDNFKTVRFADGLPAFLLDRNGTFSAPLKSQLYFGKLNYQLADAHSFELSGTARNEYDTRGFGGTTSREAAERLNNDVTTGVLKYQFAGSRFVNEAQLSLQRYEYNPVALQAGVVQEFVDRGLIGPKDSQQDLIQDRLSLRDDITSTVNGFGGTHVFKIGGNIDFTKYDVTKTLFENPKFFYFGATNFTTPAFARLGIGNPQLEASNNQFGLYAQDDWSIGERLELNLGVRWDYESNAFNNDFVTPDSIKTIIGTRANTSTMFSPSRYYASGDDRKPFKGAIQPRLGFSYDVFGTQRTTVFGGAGIYYDRNVFNNVLDERYRLQYVEYTFLFQENPGDGRIPFLPSYLSADGLRALQASGQAGRPRLFLNANDTDLPRSEQYSFGVRQVAGEFLLTASYAGVRGHNQFVYLPARDATTGSIINGPGFDQILLSSDAGKSWFDALYLKVEKPFVATARYGAQLGYTLSKASADGADEGQGNFNYDVADERSFVKHPTQGDERHRITGDWITRLNYGLLFSGTITLGSGTPYNVVTGCPNTKAVVNAARAGGNPTFEQFCVDRGFYGNGGLTGEDDFAPGTGRNSGRPPQYPFIVGRWAYRNVDLRLAKNFMFGGRQVGVVGEIFNAFGFDNLRYNTRNLRFDQVRAPVNTGSGDRTRYQVGATLRF